MCSILCTAEFAFLDAFQSHVPNPAGGDGPEGELSDQPKDEEEQEVKADTAKGGKRRSGARSRTKAEEQDAGEEEAVVEKGPAPKKARKRAK